MEFLKFKSCLADPNVWMRPAIKSNGNTYYKYILFYMGDALVVSENGETILRNELGRYNRKISMIFPWYLVVVVLITLAVFKSD